MLLHLFICHFENEPLSIFRLLELADCQRAIGQRWVSHLVTLALIEVNAGGDDVSLAPAGLSVLREYLSAGDESPVIGRLPG